MVSGPALSGGFQDIPIVRYRPDPGEPAVRLSAPEHQTAMLVSSQELRNETRLRANAVLSGDDILYSNRTFTQSIGEISPVFNAGLTTLVTRSDPNGPLPNQQIVFQSNLEDGENEGNSPKEIDQTLAQESSPQEALQDAITPTEDELEQQNQELQNEDTRLSRNLARAQLEQERALDSENPVLLTQALRDETQTEREQEEIEREQRQLDLQLAELQTVEPSASAKGIIDLMFGLLPA